jgi:hypothetical protein
MLTADRKKRHKFCKKPQNFRPFLRQLKQALGFKSTVEEAIIKHEKRRLLHFWSSGHL